MREPEAKFDELNPKAKFINLVWRDRPKPVAVSLRQVLIRFSPKALSLTPALGLMLLGTTLSIWLSDIALAPKAAYAYTNQSDLTLEIAPQETFNGLIRRAEIAARAAAQRSFDSNLLITDVSVTILGQNSRGIVPVLVLAVNRNNWRSQPDPRRWSTYFPTSKALLDLDNRTATQQPSSTATSSSVPPPTESTPPIPASASPRSPRPANPHSGAQPASETSPTTAPNPVQINIPATPSGQVGLPRSILR